MTKKTILLIIIFLTLEAMTVQASEHNVKRAFTVTTLALDAQAEKEENYEDINETNSEGGTLKNNSYTF